MSDTEWSLASIAKLREVVGKTGSPVSLRASVVLSLLDDLERVTGERDEAQATIAAVVVTLLGSGYRFPVEPA